MPVGGFNINFSRSRFGAAREWDLQFIKKNFPSKKNVKQQSLLMLAD